MEFQDKNAQRYVDNPETKQEISDIIEQRIGKTVEIELVIAKTHKHEALAEISLDEILKTAVHMPVEEED